NAGYATVRAAEAAAHAEEMMQTPNDSSRVEVIAGAFGAGRVLAANGDLSAMNQLVAALRADVDKLMDLAGGAGKALGPPIDPSETGPLGPLWPDGTPSWCSGTNA